MVKDVEKDGQPVLTVDQQVWLSAWVAVANTVNCTSKEIPAIWADECLTKFKLKFD